MTVIVQSQTHRLTADQCLAALEEAIDQAREKAGVAKIPRAIAS